MLSGIGPADHLRALGLEVVSDLPGVGANLQDHLKLSIRWQGKTVLPGSTVTAGLFTQSGRGFRRGGTPPDLQFYVGRGLDQPDPLRDHHRLACDSTVERRHPPPFRRSSGGAAGPVQLSRGSPGRGRPRARRPTGPEAGGRGSPTKPCAEKRSSPDPGRGREADLLAFVRRASDTIFHGAGTCRMGPREPRTRSWTRVAGQGCGWPASRRCIHHARGRERHHSRGLRDDRREGGGTPVERVRRRRSAPPRRGP